MKLIIGLGNPTKEYEQTRHNIGFLAIDFLLAELGVVKMKEKFESYYEKMVIDGEQYLFVKPLTYMNNSGRSIKKWVDYYDIEQEDIFVLYDDVDIEFANIRLKIGGSAGGHNGIKSMISCLSDEKFNRIRLGIGRSQHGQMVDYVLGNFSKQQLNILEEETFPLVVSLFKSLTTSTFHQLMNIYNQKKK